MEMDAGATGSMITSAMAPYQAHRDAMIRQHDAQGYDTQMFANRYSMTVQDLMRAGLNPMLAYSQGGGSPPTSPIGQGANFDTDPFGKMQAVKTNSAVEANTRQDTLKKEAETRNIDVQTLVAAGMPAVYAAQIVNLTASAEQSRAAADQIRATLPKIAQEIDNLKTQQEKNKSDVKVNESLINLNNHMAILKLAETYLTNQQTTKSKVETTILGPKEKAAKRWSANGGETSDNMGRFGRNLWDLLLPKFVQGAEQHRKGLTMAIAKTVLRAQFNYDTMAASDEAGLKCDDVSLTQQSEKEEADINTIIRKFGLSGVLPQSVRMPSYGDFTGVSTYQEALNQVIAAQASFMAMPADIRSRFNNDPEKFVAWCSDPANEKEAVKLGLIKAVAEPEPVSTGEGAETPPAQRRRQT